MKKIFPGKVNFKKRTKKYVQNEKSKKTFEK